MNKTKIAWAEKTWSPVTGCTAISDGCRNCYAEQLAKTRLKGRYGYPKDDPFKVTLHPNRLDQPGKDKTPCVIFVCSMGDLFHRDVPADYITGIWARMAAAHWHRFIVLTKRSGRMSNLLWDIWPLPVQNIMVGVTIENQAVLEKRLTDLINTPAAARLISAEPLLGSLDLMFDTEYYSTATHRIGWRKNPARSWADLIHWVIAGCETGPHHRLCRDQWLWNIRNQCIAGNVPFFLKQRYDSGGFLHRTGNLVADTWQQRPCPFFPSKEAK